jgi:hypothetical protein
VNRFIFIVLTSLVFFVEQTSFCANSDWSPIVEDWSAETLPARQLTLGTSTEFGITDDLQAGIDPISLLVGVRVLHAKWRLPFDAGDTWAMGLRYVWLNRNLLISDSLKERFQTLDGHFLRPSLAWTTGIHQQLKIHTIWATGIGRIQASLSEDGRRQYWKTKHEPQPYPESSGATARVATPIESDTSWNEAIFARQMMQLQSIAGMTEDRFQMTGDWVRSDGHRILLSTRLERTKLEDLEAFNARVTISPVWMLDQFQLRIGGGPLYAMVKGTDLDGEKINTAGWMPAGDFAMYWTF